MDKEYSLGLMVEGMKVNILMIRKKDLVYIHGKTGGSMLANGKMANNMDKAYTKT